MPDHPRNEHPVREPDSIDILLILWSVVVVLIFSHALLKGWSGKAEYLLKELFILGACTAAISLRRLRLTISLRWRKVPARLYGPTILMAVAAAVLLDELDRLTGLIISIPPEQLQHLRTTLAPESLADLFWIISGVIVAAPLIEESIFRGLIQQVLEKKGDPTRAVLLTAALFALIHFQPWWIVQLLVLSVFLGYLAWRWNSVFPAIVVHSVNNLWSLTLINLSDNSPFKSLYLWREHVSPIWLVIAVIMFAIGYRSSERSQQSRRGGDTDRP